jgi:hypothetical protein
MNTASNKINIVTEIDDIFISTHYEIQLSNCYLRKFSINIPELAYIYDVQYSFLREAISINDKNTPQCISSDEIKPNLLMFDLKDIPIVDEISIKIFTYEILEKQLGVYQYQIPYDIVDDRFEIKHDIKIRSDFGVRLLSYSKKYVINHSSSNHISLLSRISRVKNYDESLYIKFEYHCKPQSVLYRYPKENSDFFLLENSFTPKNVDEDNLQEIFFLLDLSQGITKKQIELRLEAINQILSKIRSIDKINICVFSDKYHIFSPSSVIASDENIKKIIDYLNGFSSKGNAKIDKAMDNVAKIPVPLGYTRNYFLFAGSQQYQMKIINNICQNLLSSKLFLFQFNSSNNKKFISDIAIRNIADYFVINDSESIDHLTRNFNYILKSGLISEIDFDFGEAQISRISNDQPVVFPLYRTLYVAGETIGSITETPFIRILINGKELVSKCDKIIETHSEILKYYIESGGFKTANPNIKNLRSPDENKMINRATRIFDDFSNNDEDAIVINKIDNCNGLNFSIYCDHKILEDDISFDISKDIPQFEAIFVKATQKLITKEITVFISIKPNLIKFNSIFFGQVEYDDKIEKDLKKDLQELIESLSLCINAECKLIFNYCIVSP